MLPLRPVWVIMSPCPQSLPSKFSLCTATRDTFLKQMSALVTSLLKSSSYFQKTTGQALSFKTFQIAQQTTSLCVLGSGSNYLTCILTPLYQLPCKCKMGSALLSLSVPPPPPFLPLKQNSTCNTFTNVENRAMCFVIFLALFHTTRQSFLLFKLDEIIVIQKL